jgi:XTP/dITP diphosphohydrolase
MVRSAYCYFDGQGLEVIVGGLEGEVAAKPDGDNGFGWDNIFIPKGYSKTRATLDEESYQKTYAQMRPIGQLREFLSSL